MSNDIEEKFKVSYYRDDNDNTLNNLKDIMQGRGITPAELAAELHISQQQISKYIHGINLLDVEKLALVSRFLNCLPSDIYPQLDVKNKTKLMSTKGREEKLKKQQSSIVNNTYITNNNGVSTEMGNFFKHITTVDFLTLNKKVVVFLLALVAVGLILGQIIYLANLQPPETDFKIRALMLLNLLDYNIMLMGIGLGLVIPLIVQSVFSYVPLWVGLKAAVYFFAHHLGIKVGISDILHSDKAIIMFIALLLTLIYAYMIKRLKAKHLIK